MSYSEAIARAPFRSRGSVVTSLTRSPSSQTSRSCSRRPFRYCLPVRAGITALPVGDVTRETTPKHSEKPLDRPENPLWWDIGSASVFAKSIIYMLCMQTMDIRAVDLNLLKAFDALMTERAVTRAANRIGLSQPA